MQIVQSQATISDPYASWANIGESIGRGILQGMAWKREDRQRAEAVARENAKTASNSLMGAALAPYEQYGSAAFDPNSEAGGGGAAQANIALLDQALGQYQASVGEALTDEARSALRESILRGSMTPEQLGKFRALGWQGTGETGGAGTSTPAGYAASQASSMLDEAKGQRPGAPAAAPKAPAAQRYSTVDMYAAAEALAKQRLADYARQNPSVPQAALPTNSAPDQLAIYREMLSDPAKAEEYMRQYRGMAPGAGQVRSGIPQAIRARGTGVPEMPKGKLAAYEKRTGDEHYPAQVGIDEGIVNANAMAHGGSKLVAALNRRWPADGTRSRSLRGSYPDGYAGAAGMGLAPGAPALRPGTPEYEAWLRSQAPQAVAAPQAMPSAAPPSEASAAVRSSMVQSLASGVPAPKPAAGDPIAAAAAKADLVKSTNSFPSLKLEELDPRNKAVVARQLSEERSAANKALGASADRAAWMRRVSQNVANFLREAPDEELALAFGPTVASARNNRETRDLEARKLLAEVMLQSTQTKTLQNLAQTMSMQVLAQNIDPTKFKDKDGNIDEKQIAKYLTAFPLVRVAAENVNKILGNPGKGVADTVPEVLGWWAQLTGGRPGMTLNLSPGAANVGASVPVGGVPPQQGPTQTSTRVTQYLQQRGIGQ